MDNKRREEALERLNQFSMIRKNGFDDMSTEKIEKLAETLEKSFQIAFGNEDDL